MKICKHKIVLLLLIPGIFILIFSCRHKEEDKQAADSVADESIMLSDAQVNLANIRYTEVREGSLGNKLSLPGVLKVNEQSAVTISSRVPGRIEKLYFRNSGETVSKGDRLYEFYSEELVSTQREFFTLQSNNWNFSGKYQPSLALENKLLLMGMLPSQIEQLRKDGKLLFRVIIYSPAGGKIRSVNVTEGEYINVGQPLFELAEDINLWVEAQLYPDEIQLLKAGMPATLVVPAAGEFTIRCNVSFINPSFESGKNVTLVRAVIQNPDNKLHPGMFAMLNIETSTVRGLIIPSAAVISGKGVERVWVRDEYGNFTGRLVTTGLQSGDSVLVLSGLGKSEVVVTSGAYLLDSEFILKQGAGSDPETGLLSNARDEQHAEHISN